MSKVGLWSTTAANNNSTPPDGWPEGQAPSTVNDCAREMMAQIRTLFNDPQFVDQGFVPTRLSATSFSVPGDQTSAIHAGRRLKLFDATAGVATTIYATVQTSSFTVVTTVAVYNDAGNLTSSLSSFAIAVLSSTNPSNPKLPQTAKVWAAWSGVGVVTLRNSFNVTSITDGGVGNYIVNFTQSTSSTAYAVMAWPDNTGTVLIIAQHNPLSGAKTTTTYQVDTQTPTTSATDSPSVSFFLFEQ